MKIIYLKFLLLFLFSPVLSVLAQEQVLTGLVKDAQGPMPGATVYLQNKENRSLGGVTTNNKGEFFIHVPQGMGVESIVFSFIGYKTKTVKIGTQKHFNILLEVNVELLDEAVVTAKAVEKDAMGMDSKALGGARQKINLDEFQDMTVTSVEDMLQGKLANVDIVATSGAPGAKMSMRIRGTASLNASNEPLIVIDDIPQENIDIADDFDFTVATEDDYGALVNISPSDIQSIEVLKDASATAIWGAQAANGVLVITTKTGVARKPSFTLTEKVSTSIEPKRMPMLNAKEYVTLMQDAIWNRVRDDEYDDLTKLKKYKDILYDPTYTYFKEFNQETDWMKHVVMVPVNSETNLSMSGGGDKATYYFSLGYMKQRGTTIGEEFSRITSRMKVTYAFSKRFSIVTQFFYGEGNKTGNLGGPRGIAQTKMPNMTPYILDEYGNMTDEYFRAPSSCIQGSMDHPIALARESQSNKLSRDMGINLNISYKILAGLSFSAVAAFDLNTSVSKSFNPSSATGNVLGDKSYNEGSESMSNGNKIYLKTGFNYDKMLEDHRFTVSLRFQGTDVSNGSYLGKTGGNVSTNMSDPSANGNLINVAAGKSQNRAIGFIGSFLYTYKSAFNVNVSLRSDGNSRTGRDSRWGTFPSVNGSWHLHRHEALKKWSWLSEAILRLGWGRSGTSPSGSSTYAGTYGADDDVYMNLTGIKPNSMQLNKLKWETTTQMNYGFDVAFMDDKIRMSFDTYTKITDDLLQQKMRIQSSTGYPSVPWFNDGAMSNKGWEVSLNMRDVVNTGDFKLNVSFNISRNRNTVKELPMSLIYKEAEISNGAYSNKVVVDRPVGSFYGFRYLGVYQNFDETIARDNMGNVIKDVNGKVLTTTISGTHQQRPGDAKYYDVNFDGIIDKYDIVYLGNAMPIMIGGGSVTMNYKGLNLRVSTAYRIGQSIINRARLNAEQMSSASNQSSSVLRRWRYEGDDTEIPRALWGKNFNSLGSDRYVEKASFLKVKDITLSYRFKPNVIQRVGLKGLYLFATSYDPFTITNYKGQDPEVGIPGGFGNLAEDKSLSPRARRFAFGMNIDF